MARAYSYANRDDFKTWLQGLATTNTTHDAVYDAILQAVSRQIDKYCGRDFAPYTATKYFSAERGDILALDDDLLSITTLKTSNQEDSGARTYENTWATTDYDLEPYNAPDDEAPYTLIRGRGTGQYTFPVGVRKGVEIAGSWGYWSATASVGTTAEELDATETAVDVSAGHSIKPLMTLLVESEQMFVTAVATNTLTVKRGVNGTTAATHATSKAVTAYEYPFPIVQACYLMTARLFTRRSAPIGVAGSAEMGTLTVIPKIDPDIRGILNDYRRLFIGVA